MSLVGASLEVKGTFGRWSTRFFTLIGTEDGTLLLRTYVNEEAHDSNRDPQSTRAIAGFSDLEDRDSARPNRFDLTLVRGNGTVSLAAADAETKAAWTTVVVQVLGASSRQTRSDSVPHGDAGAFGAAADAAADASAELALLLVEAKAELGTELVEKYRVAFEAAEQDGDGVLNAAELADLASGHLFHVPEEGEIDDMIAAVDTDADGGLDLGEFLQAMRQRRWGEGPAVELEPEGFFLQMLSPGIPNGGARVRRTADRDDDNRVGVIHWRDYEGNRIRVSEEREVNGEKWYKVHSDSYPTLEAHDDFVEHDRRTEGWLVNIIDDDGAMYEAHVPLDAPVPRRAERGDRVRVLSGRTAAGLAARPEEGEENAFFIKRDDHDQQPYQLYQRESGHYYYEHEVALIDEATESRAKLLCPGPEHHEMVRCAFYKMEYSGGASCDWCSNGIAVGQERWFCPECQADVCFKCRPPCAGVPNSHPDAPAAVEFHTMDEDGSKTTFVVDAADGKLAYCVDDAMRIAQAEVRDEEGPTCSRGHLLTDRGETPTSYWSCDISGDACTNDRPGLIGRYRCSQGCDYDACAGCYSAESHACEANTFVVVGTACGCDGQACVKVQAPTAEDVDRVRALAEATASAGATGSAGSAGSSGESGDETAPSSAPVPFRGLQARLEPQEFECPLSGIWADSRSSLDGIDTSHGPLKSETSHAPGAVSCSCCGKRSAEGDEAWRGCVDCKFNLCPECSSDSTTLRYARHAAKGKIEECPNESDFLKPFKITRNGYGCDGCRSSIAVGSYSFGCHDCCDFDLCAQCFMDTTKRRTALAEAREIVQQIRQRREEEEQEEERRWQEERDAAGSDEEEEGGDPNRATKGDYCEISYNGDSEHPKGIYYGRIIRDDKDSQPYQVEALVLKEKAEKASPLKTGDEKPKLEPFEDEEANWDPLPAWFYEKADHEEQNWATKFIPDDDDDGEAEVAVSEHSGFLVAAQDTEDELFKVDENTYFVEGEGDAKKRVARDTTKDDAKKLRNTVVLDFTNEDHTAEGHCLNKTVCLKGAFAYSRADFNRGEMPYFEVTFENVKYMEGVKFTDMSKEKDGKMEQDDNFVKNVPSVGIGLMKAPSSVKELYDQKLWDHPNADKLAKEARKKAETKQRDDAAGQQISSAKSKDPKAAQKKEKKEKKEALKAASKAIKAELAGRPCARSFVQPWTIVNTKKCSKALAVANAAEKQESAAGEGGTSAAGGAEKVKATELKKTAMKRRVGLDIQDSFGYYSDGSVKVKHGSSPEAEAYFFHRAEDGDNSEADAPEGDWLDSPHDDKRNLKPFETATFAARDSDKASTVGCGLDVGQRELFFTRERSDGEMEYIGTASFRACGKRSDINDSARFIPVITFTGVLSAKVTINFCAKGDEMAASKKDSAADAGKKEQEGSGETAANAGRTIYADVPFCSSAQFSDLQGLATTQDGEAVPVNDIPFLPEFSAMMKYIALKHDKMDDGKDDVEKDLHHVIEDYVNAQVSMYNKQFNLGDEVTFAIPDQGVGVNAKKITGDGIMCRVPPPGGHGAFVSDVLCEGYVVMRTDKDSGEDHTFYEVPSEDCLKKVASTAKKFTISTRFVRVLTQAVRFSHNPISAALGASYACASAASLQGTTKKQQGLLKGHAEKFSNMAKALVDNINDASKLGVLLPRTQQQLATVPQQRQDETAIELALTLEDREFTCHKDVEEHVEELWRGGSANLWSSLKFPGMADLLHSKEVMDILSHNVEKLTDIDLIMSPVVRFFTAFSFLCGLVALQHSVVYTPSTFDSVANFTNTEYVFIIVSFGFLFSEVEEVQAAISRRRITKYLSDGWNIIDWLLHFVFAYYFFTRWEGVHKPTSVPLVGVGDNLCRDSLQAELADGTAAFPGCKEARTAMRILSFNCIFLWVRLMNVMTVSSKLGPMIRMITLMAKDVAVFLVMLFMYIVGFAGTFYVWFKDVPDDGAADMDGLKVDIITELGASMTPKVTATASSATELDPAGFQTPVMTMMTLFSAAMGDFSFDAIRKPEHGQPWLGPILMMLYLFVGAVMLLNLLIAILSDVYATVNDGAQKEVAFTKAKTVTTYRVFWDKKRTLIPLPPPLNLVTAAVLPISWVVQGVAYLVNTIKSCTASSDNADASTLRRQSSRSGRAGSGSKGSSRELRELINAEKEMKKKQLDPAAASLQLHSTVNAGLLIATLSTMMGCCVWALATAAYALMIPVLIVNTLPAALQVGKDAAKVAKKMTKSDGAVGSIVFAVACIVCLPFAFAMQLVLTILYMTYLIVYMALVMPLKIFAAGCVSMAEVCDAQHLDVVWLNELLTAGQKDDSSSAKTDEEKQHERMTDKLKKIKDRYDEEGDHGAGRRNSPQAAAWWKQFVIWKREAVLQRLNESQMSTKDGKMVCKDPLAEKAMLLRKSDESNDARKKYLASKEIVQKQSEIEETGIYAKGGDEETPLKVENYIDSFKVELECVSASDKKVSKRTYFLFEDYVMYMVFRYPSPPAVSLGDVCTLSSKDIAETGSGALTKEGQRLADEKQQREEIAQEVSNRMDANPSKNADQVLNNTKSMKLQLDELTKLVERLTQAQ